MPGIGAFFGNRSIVFHYANKTRISCANFALVDAGDTGRLPVSAASTTVTITDTVATVCPSETPYCYDSANSTTTVPFESTGGLTLSDGDAALPTDDADDVDDGDDADDVDDER